jgi:arylsulfatase A-like enzyme
LRELHEGKDNLVVFCSDHGDAFGEQGWLYHFSNVTDGGNRVPLVYLRPGDEASRRIDAVVSARDLFHSLLRDAGLPSDGPHLVDEPERSVPYLESFWYNNQGRTLPRYRFNQNLLFAEGRRYLRRQGAWYVAPPQVDGEEPPFEPLPLEADPLQDLAMEPEHRRFYVDAFAGHEAFCRRLPS